MKCNFLSEAAFKKAMEKESVEIKLAVLSASGVTETVKRVPKPIEKGQLIQKSCSTRYNKFSAITVV
jgi:hypothetical protein